MLYFSKTPDARYPLFIFLASTDNTLSAFDLLLAMTSGFLFCFMSSHSEGNFFGGLYLMMRCVHMSVSVRAG